MTPIGNNSEVAATRTLGRAAIASLSTIVINATIARHAAVGQLRAGQTALAHCGALAFGIHRTLFVSTNEKAPRVDTATREPIGTIAVLDASPFDVARLGRSRLEASVDGGTFLIADHFLWAMVSRFSGKSAARRSANAA
jgi:hypothetical protein